MSLESTPEPKSGSQPPAGIAVNGARLHAEWLSPAAQAALVEDVRGVVESAPFLSPMTPWGKPMTVRMTSAGTVGWVSDRSGYRYAPHHPATGAPWPPIPDSVLSVWRALSGAAVEPDCCLINYYAASARMGLHQDKDEADFSIPVLSISLGDPATFRIGGLARRDPTTSVTLSSGDVLVMGGDARLAYHGIDRVKFGGSTLLRDGGRLNLTLRRALPT
ncbi:MAG: alpha-ketoglutarate-dependent dioxygenase AlkB [Rhodobacteraceae bacterium]|nr:alpha-ketoglutarate-dependent dioxygenase AlkB [Paracoccaceae bacterium]